MIRRVFCLILCLAFMLSACASPAAAPQATPIISTPPPAESMEALQSKKLTVSLCGETAALHPLLSREKNARSVLGLIFESLLETDALGDLQPCLASSWSHDSTGRIWTFRLRTQAVWQSALGTLSPEDVIFTLDLIREIGNDGPYAYLLDEISSWKAVGDDSVELVFSHTAFSSLYLLDFPILPAAGGYTADNAPMLMPGSGPYQIQDFPADDQILLERNKDWWKLPPSIEQIQVNFYPSLEAATSALSLRQVDVVETSSLTTDQYKYGNNATVFEYNSPELECIYLNLNTYVLQNRYLRQAISYALNRSGIAETAFIRHAVVVDTPVSPSSPLSRGTAMKYVYDPEEAGRLISRTGWKDSDGDGILDTTPSGAWQVLTLRLAAMDSPQQEEAASAISQQLRAVGIDVDLQILSRDEYKKAIEERSFDLLLASVYLDNVPDYTKLLGSDGALNLSRWSDETTDGYLAAARNALTMDELSAATAEIRTVFLDTQPMICLFYRTHSLLLSSRIEGVSCVRDGDAYCDIASWTLYHSEQ